MNTRIDAIENAALEALRDASPDVAALLDGLVADAQRYRKVKAAAFIRNFDGGNSSHWVLPTFERHNDSPNPSYRMAPRPLDDAIDGDRT